MEKITVNGNQVDWVEGETLSRLLERMNFVFRLLAIKINGEIVPKEDYAKALIPKGAKVEVIHLISGG